MLIFQVSPMSASVFLSLAPPSNCPHFANSSIPIAESYIPTLLLPIPNIFKNSNPICLSGGPPKYNFTTCSTASGCSNSINTTDDDSNNCKNKLIKSTDSNSSEPFLLARKVPTAPWMTSPLRVEPPTEVLDFSKTRNQDSIRVKSKKHNESLTDKVRGGRGKKAMRKIFQGIGKLRESHNLGENQKITEQIKLDFLSGEFLQYGNPDFQGKMPWESSDERIIFRRMKKERVVTAAELSLDGDLLERLRVEAATMRKWVKVKKAGVTEAVVDQIQFIWKNNELAMLKFDLPLCRNMDRAREIVEFKTGGLVVWSNKDAHVIYRGCNYQLKKKSCWIRHPGLVGGQETFSSNISYRKTVFEGKSTVEEMNSRKHFKDDTVPIDGSLYEREADRLLDGLGPRYVDWWRPKPLPVDADLLPEVVPGFKPPFRLCPPRAESKLEDDELTYLRKLAHPLPTHFVLGRNGKLQGLAAAILKLWGKCHIAKIAVKWGIPNTNNEQMANELKSLTGGVLLLRNKFFIILYRGKDFLPCEVANLVAEREMELKRCQLQEETARLKAAETIYLNDELSMRTSTIGTLSEFQNIQLECGDLKNGNKEVEIHLTVEKERLEKELRQQERKLFILQMKIKRASKELERLNSAWRPAEQDTDREIITPEERECFQKIARKMDNSLVLGRRGVFDGVIEGLHQHWKHREIVKVITMQKLFWQVTYTAKLLETESGGILISIEKLKEGHAIIMYRGKNYRRPLKLVTDNLLNKREALNRSLELQRLGSLKFFAYQRQQAISDLKSKLAEVQEEKFIEEN